ncbi:MAG: bifunctional homocysteine S-methyltransferase/methylenetetrahydrofolate reductase [Anaerolineaceae bacterium]|nr:bifunctional homocysteine S-methyltransferase/methylenetetrahydrofolate reductase [Anaerolineaceae bacterium]
MEKTQNPFLNLTNSDRPVLFDGAMGTILYQRGVGFDECFDELNFTQPALIAEIHREYIEAGAQVIQTNTFSANRYKLARHGLEERLIEINTAGVELAKRVVMASFKPVLIAGDVGPLGVRLAPFGRVQIEEATEAFSEQIEALVNAGVDLIIIETMTDLYEVRCAIQAARAVAPHLPVIAAMTFTRDDRTLLGDSPSQVALGIAEEGADVIGANCSGGPNQILRILKQMRQAVPQGRFSVMPNAGWPEQMGDRIMYRAAPEYFGEYALAFWQAGACVIGGCCGTTPDHIRAMSRTLQSVSNLNASNNFTISTDEGEELSPADQPTELSKKLASGRYIIAVEMSPPRGLSAHKLLAGASLLAESGADAINVADSPMARMRMSPWAVCNLVQKKVGIETVLHFPTRGRSLIRVQGDLLASYALGVRNVFVVMGDPTAIGDYPDAMDDYDLVPSGLIKLIKQGFNAGVDHAGVNIGQPTTFLVGCALNLLPPDPLKEIKTLKKKIEAGADFILTQPVYDPKPVNAFLDLYQEAYGHLATPLIVGALPLASSRHANFLNQEVPGITVPESLIERMASSGENGAETGVEITLELIEETKSYAQGVYLMPAFNRYDRIAEIIEKARMLAPRLT